MKPEAKGEGSWGNSHVTRPCVVGVREVWWPQWHSREGCEAKSGPHGVCDSQTLFQGGAGPGATTTLVSHFELSPLYYMAELGLWALTLGGLLWATFSS